MKKLSLVMSTLIMSSLFVFSSYAKECSVTYMDKPITENSDIESETGNSYYWLILNGYEDTKLNLDDFKTKEGKILTESGKNYYEIRIDNIPELVENTEGKYSKKSNIYSILRIQTDKNGDKQNYDFIYVSKLPIGVNPELLGSDKKYVIDTKENIVYNGFKSNEQGTWYERYDGNYPINKWERIAGDWYKFDPEGYIVNGWIAEEVYSENNEFERTDWYYCDTTTNKMYTDWAKIEDKWYYFQDNGVMLVDNITPDGYKVDKDGISIEKAEAETVNIE